MSTFARDPRAAALITAVALTLAGTLTGCSEALPAGPAPEASAIESPLTSGDLGQAAPAAPHGTPPATSSRSTPVATLGYLNGRYGFSVSVPDWLRGGESANGDGATYSADGFEFRVYGSNLVLSERDFVHSRMTERTTVTYEATGDRSFTRSGVVEPDQSEPEVFYWLAYHGAGSMNILEITYPESRKADFDPVTESLVKSFAPGDLSRPH